MTERNANITEADLHAYADGRLDEEGRSRVQVFLAAHPEKAREVADWQAQNEAINALYGHVVQEAVPDRLRPHRMAARAGASGRPWRFAAAAVLLLVLGGGMGWFARDYFQPGEGAEAPLVRQAMAAHAVYAVEVRHPVEVGVDEQQHLVAWLSKRLQQPVKAPSLSQLGFELVGGRLLPAAAGPAAQFMYEDPSGRRVTLYLTRHDRSDRAAFRFASDDTMNAFYWLDETTSYALVGDIARDRLQRLAHEVYDQISR